MFDGKSIGLVELKYNAKSMEIGSANSLYEHMLDFYDIIHWNGKRCLTECIRRMKMMCDNEVIDESWKNLIETFEKKVATGIAEQYLWCGFVFAGNEQDEHIVLDAVKSQLFTEPSTQEGSREKCLNLDSRNYDNIDVRYQYIVVDTSKNEKEDMIFEDMILKEKIKERIGKR